MLLTVFRHVKYNPMQSASKGFSLFLGSLSGQLKWGVDGGEGVCTPPPQAPSGPPRRGASPLWTSSARHSGATPFSGPCGTPFPMPYSSTSFSVCFSFNPALYFYHLQKLSKNILVKNVCEFAKKTLIFKNITPAWLT